ncbi:MAG: S9 family peptidase [Erysipelotrichaceae bacterium]|nr:S9 family peptidase [Erysipelotrichaceae bacterium]
MKPIELDTMLGYRYLSGLDTCKNKLVYTDTLADKEKNDYTQRLHLLDPENKEDTVLLEDRRIRYQLIDDEIYVLKNENDKYLETSVYKYENGLNKVCDLPVEVNKIHSLNDDYFFVEATSHMDCPDYYKSSLEEKDKYHKNVEDNKDYLVLDEYPFFFNGAGFINGNRNSGYLLSKKDCSLKRITPYTMDIEDVQTDGNKVYLLANDYQSMKKIWSSIYEYDTDTDELKCIYKNGKIYFRKIVMLKGKLTAMGSEKTCISGQSFYQLTDNDMKKIYETEYMFFNSVTTDCRYGHGRNNMTVNGNLYILNTIDERSVLNRFDGEKLEYMTDFEGSTDDFTFIGDDLYIIAMKDMKLQEIYKVEDDYKQITSLNEEVLKDRYVAKPEKMSCFNIHEIRGFVLKPYGFDPDKKYPMILDIHGGPKGAYGPIYSHEMQLWASKGYFVIYCNPHCSDGRGDEFSDYISHYGSTDYDDLMKFVDTALETYPQIDKDKLCVTGGSYGGYMTNWIITHTDRFVAAASQRSISNRVADFYYSDYAYDVTYENGIPRDDAAIKLFWDRSPIKYVDNAVTPTLFIQSTEDYRCPFPEAVQLFSALKWKGVETRLCGFKGENHELSRSGKPLHRLRRLSEITEWMEKHTR